MTATVNKSGKLLSRTVGRLLASVCCPASLFVACALFVGGCTTSVVRTPVPADRIEDAVIPGIPNARIMRVYTREEIDQGVEAVFEQRASQVVAGTDDMRDIDLNILALSGGGGDGAFGAGLLAGWNASGSRPEFSIVTGVSTGALMAPFVFLGPEYDSHLKKLYTTTSTRDVVRRRPFMSALRSDAVTDSEPLRSLVKSYVDADFLNRIAAEHKRGRRLWVMTSNLDAGRTTIWNMGAIASSIDPGAPQLFRDVMVASASIPVAFPPVYIDVEVDGKIYQETHVDGGVSSQVFIYPNWFDLGKKMQSAGLTGKRRVYVIRNSKPLSTPERVDSRIGSIAGRSLSMLITQQGFADIVRVYSLAARDQIEFYLAYIPMDYPGEPAEPFDPVYMTKLYEFGYQMAKDGYPWTRTLEYSDDSEALN